MTLTNTGNAVGGVVQFADTGATTFYNTVATNLGTSTLGGDLTLLSKGSINVTGTATGPKPTNACGSSGCCWPGGKRSLPSHEPLVD